MQRKTQRFLPFAVSTYWKLCQYTYTTSITYITSLGIWRKVTMKPFLCTRNTNENLKPVCITGQSIRNYLMRTYSYPIEHVECRCHVWSPVQALSADRRSTWWSNRWRQLPFEDCRVAMKHLNSLDTLYYCHRQSALFRRVNFWSKDRLTKKKDRILIKDLVSNNWKYQTKEAGLILQSGICIYFYQYFGRHGLPSSGSYI